MTPETRKEIIRLLTYTNMNRGDIGKKVGVSRNTVTRAGVKAGIDMQARQCNSSVRSKRSTRKRHYSTHVHDTMTGDGLSLLWLSKEWKL